jgi:hypothetical protein
MTKKSKPPKRTPREVAHDRAIAQRLRELKWRLAHLRRLGAVTEKLVPKGTNS